MPTRKRKKLPAQLDREIAAALSRRKPSHAARKKSSGNQLVVEYDVTGLSRAQIDELAGHALAQAEASDYGQDEDNHPSVKVTSRIDKRGKRKHLVVTYNVTGLSDREIGVLEGEAIAQAEENDPGLITNGVPMFTVYPTVPVTSKIL